jgi:hypothetical protein
MARLFFVEFWDFPIARGRAAFDSRAKFQSEKVMADVFLAIAIAGANTLIVMAVAIAFVII